MLGNRALLPVGEAVVGFIQGGIQHLPEVQLVRPGGGIYRHILAGLITVLIVLQAEILLTVGGSLLMERFFSVPGMGPLLTDAIQRYDLNVVQTLVILYAALGIVGVFLGDVLMMLVDPRITLTGKEAAR